MAAAYSLRCSACGREFLATHTRPDTLTTCPHCAHLAPLREFLAAGAAPLGDAPVSMVRKRIPARPQNDKVSASGQMLMEFSPASEVASAAGVQVGPQRRGPANPAFVPLEAVSADWLPTPPPGRSPITLVKMTGCVLGVMLLAGAGWFINRTPNSTEGIDVETSVSSPAATASSLPPQAVRENRDGPAQSNAPTPSTTPSALPDPALAMDNEIESARLNGEAPEVMRALFEGPAEERTRHVQGGGQLAARLDAFFNRAEPVLPGALRRLPVNPIDLINGQPAVLFQATTSANSRGALARFLRGGDGVLRLDWGLFEETHDHELERFLQADTSTGPRWFQAGIRRSHGLDLEPEFGETHHVFDLQVAPGSLLGRPGVVARELPVGRYLNQNTDWRATYLARLLLSKRTLPGGVEVVEIIDCEGAGLSRASAQ